MLPIPPLDGSRFLRTFLPDQVRAVFDQMDRFGIMIVFFVIIFFRDALGIVLFAGIGLFWQGLLRLDMGTFQTVWDGFREALG